MQWAVHPGGSWQVSRGWDANVKHIGSFLWECWGAWLGNCPHGPMKIRSCSVLFAQVFCSPVGIRNPNGKQWSRLGQL